jgi:hypothetical protein
LQQRAYLLATHSPARLAFVLCVCQATTAPEPSRTPHAQALPVAAGPSALSSVRAHVGIVHNLANNPEPSWVAVAGRQTKYFLIILSVWVYQQELLDRNILNTLSKASEI